jgi:hypothetical protein
MSSLGFTTYCAMISFRYSAVRKGEDMFVLAEPA